MISVLITLEIIDKGRKNYRIMSDWEREFISLSSLYFQNTMEKDNIINKITFIIKNDI